MKTKNLMLGILALTIAVGSAFASITSSANNGYIKVLLTDDTQDCRAVGECNLMTGATCKATFSNNTFINNEEHPLRPVDCPESTINHSTGSIGSIQIGDDVKEIIDP